MYGHSEAFHASVRLRHLGKSGDSGEPAEIASASRAFVEVCGAYPEQKGQPPVVWPEFTLQQCENLANDLARLWRRYLEMSSEGDLADSVGYRNSQGEAWSSRKDDILMHVVMHSAYHRGQIAADMRSAGLVPAYTDFIHSVRQEFVE